VKPYAVPLDQQIEPLPPAAVRPLFSVMIPAYNYDDYMPGTLRSVLRQDPGDAEMQITVVDDCSTAGDPEAIVREIGGGRISFERQPRNVGMIKNFNDCIRRARGEWVHILHGDDTVRPDFYARAAQAIRAHPEIGAWACRVIYMDEEGVWTGLSDLDARTPQVLGDDLAARQLIEQRFQFVCMLVKRSVYEQLGGFRPELKLCFDWDMWKRVALHVPVFYDPEPLACFRLHARSAYAKAVRTGESVADERHGIEIACSYVPPAQAARLRRTASKAAAVRALRTAGQQWKLGYRAGALRLIKEALHCSVAPAVLVRLLWSLPLMAQGMLHKRIRPVIVAPLAPRAAPPVDQFPQPLAPST
jgi:hypothetical protein